MSGDTTQWVAEKLAERKDVTVIGRTPDGFLSVQSRSGYTFQVAVVGVANVIVAADVAPVFAGANRPQLVVNVPSKTLWSGEAIDLVHASSAAFGVLGDISRAANTGDAGTYRDRNMGFFIDALRMHSNVGHFTYVYESVFRVQRRQGNSVTIAVTDAYNMGAEHVRNTRLRVGPFDVIVKSSSYGSITPEAVFAAQDIGADALTFRELMQKLRA